MDRNIKLLAASSLAAVLASGCTPYNARTGTYDNSNTGLGTGASQNSQVAAKNVNVPNKNSTCSACAAKKTTVVRQNTYTPAPAAGKHTQQWYIDRWNREQQQAQYRSQPQAQPKPQQPVQPRVVQPQPAPKTYSGYGGAKATKPTTTNYYDYSQAGGYGTTDQASKNVVSNKNIYSGTSNAASSKSIYTGSYQNNTYQPKTYSSGANNTPDTSTSYSSGSVYTAGGDNQSDGAPIATGTYSAGDSNYTVRKGDTVFSVMRLTNVYWKDIIKLNGLQAPYTISPGQSLRLK